MSDASDLHPDRHPSAEALAGHAGGALEESQAETVREHLAECTHCTRIVLDLTAPGPEVEAEPGDPELAVAWRAHLARRGTDRSPDGGIDPGVLQRQPARKSPRLWPAMAASLLIGAVIGGTLVELGSSRNTDDERILKPAIGLPSIDLIPLGSLPDPPPIPRLAVRPDLSLLDLNLRLLEPPPSDHVVVEILDARGATVWRDEGRIPQSVDLTPGGSAKHLNLVLPRDLLSLGAHRVRLLDPSHPEARPFAEYRFQLAAAERGPTE